MRSKRKCVYGGIIRKSQKHLAIVVVVQINSHNHNHGHRTGSSYSVVSPVEGVPHFFYLHNLLLACVSHLVITDCACATIALPSNRSELLHRP